VITKSLMPWIVIHRTPQPMFASCAVPLSYISRRLGDGMAHLLRARPLIQLRMNNVASDYTNLWTAPPLMALRAHIKDDTTHRAWSKPVTTIYKVASDQYKSHGIGGFFETAGCMMRCGCCSILPALNILNTCLVSSRRIDCAAISNARVSCRRAIEL
jgi:hypothetical protein